MPLYQTQVCVNCRGRDIFIWMMPLFLSGFVRDGCMITQGPGRSLRCSRFCDKFYGEQGVPWSDDKAVLKQTKATRLGVEGDGERGSLGVSVEKRLTIFQLGVFFLLWARISGLVTASDASEAGGGVCAGERVTAIGQQVRQASRQFLSS